MTMAVRKIFTLPFLLLAVTAAAPAAQAEDSGVRGHILLGGGMKPEYEGSEDYEATPIAGAKVEYQGYYLETRGLGLRANVSPLAHIEFGPSINYRGGRDDDVENDAVAAMREIEGAVELGAFVKIPFRQLLHKTDELSLKAEFLADVSGEHDGYLVEFGPSYSYAPMDKLRIGVDLSTTYASEDYNQTYFGIDADNALRSGLAQYSADAGFKDVSIGVTALYQINDRWGVMGVARYTQLVGDAADSPIVDDEGSSGQALVGAGVMYRF